MPYIGVGLHLFIALFFAIHAVRSGRDIYWLMILFFFPGLGSIVYFFAIYLPDSRIPHKLSKTVASAAKSLDPGRDLREALQAFDFTPTAQNQVALAKAYMAAGDAAQAIHHYDICLQGPFANAPDIRLGAAHAKILNGQAHGAIELLEGIRKSNPDFSPEQVSMLLAQAYSKDGRMHDAGTEFAHANHHFGSMEIRVEYAIWALQAGEQGIADQLYAEIQQTMKHWGKDTKAMNRDLIKRLNGAFAGRK